MASSSSSHPRNKYHVFLSFRGEETRHNFTSHLYEALCQKSIETFIDEQLIRGDEISQSLLDAIEASTISLIIFSEGYASSRWCLDELVKIFECKNQHGQIVIPVFYGVDPSHVRNQTGIFGDIFSKLEHRWGPEKMKIWRNALTEAANLSGFDSHTTRLESELIKEVVNHIMKRLAKVFPRDNKGQLVGVKSTIKEIESLLALGSDAKDAYTLGIWGIGGIGKTTIARAIFDRISNNFEGSCFLQNVREESQRPGGLSCLQQKLVSQLWRDENVIRDIDHLIFTRLRHKKVLIVLDDVTCLNQIESLIGRFDDQFMPQSRIIITTRNKDVLRNWGVEKIYEVKALRYRHALQLFSRHAFRQNHPDIGYEEHSNKVIRYAEGVPLALKVLGHYLFKRETEVWESAINKLENIPNQEIHEVLKISYDALDDQEKNIFLDVACFLNGEDECFVMKFLNESGFYAEIGISVLVDKSLVIKQDNKITMHDLLQEMGKEIVKQESSENPEKRSRLWNHDDIIKVLKFNKGTEAIKAIYLDMGRVNEEIYLNSDTFSKMPNLRFLKLYNSIKCGENKLKVPYFQGLGLDEVRCLYWHGYPLKSLPSNIHLEKLVSLEMPHSNIEQLWSDVQHYGNLNQIIMAACKKFFTRIPNPSLTSHPNKLVTLNLLGCKNLKSIPAITDLKSLKTLVFTGCSKIKRIPEFSSSNIEEMCFGGTAIEELPSSIVCLSRLSTLNLRSCRSLKSLPSNLGKLKSLKMLLVDFCSNLQRLPDELGNLETLYACKTWKFRWHNLCSLGLQGSRALSWPTPLSLDGLHSITSLYLTDCGITELPESFGQLVSLQRLDLDNNEFERLPESVIQLPKLEDLSLRNCERLQSILKLPLNLLYLSAELCMSLKSVLALFTSNEYPEQQYIDLSENFKLDGNEIVEDALQKLQLKATTRWKHVGKEVCYEGSRGYVILPGNEIPRWFRYQSMGSSVSLKGTVPGLFSNNKVIGFAFSAVLAFQPCHHYGTWLSVHCQFKFESNDADRLDFKMWYGKLVISKSDHIYLGYHFFDYEEFNYFKQLNCLPDRFHIYCMEDNSLKPSDDLWVKKCGIHFFYISEDYFNCNEEEEPHPKRLKILEDIYLN